MSNRLTKHLLATAFIFFFSAVAVAEKPRIVVLTDIAPNDVEPDDMESIIRLFVHADLFEIEGLVATTGWSNGGGQERLDLIHDAINAYEKDLPNLLKISDQREHLEDETRQEIGYWPSPDYLRSCTMFGSRKRGMSFIGEENDSPGSELIIQLADDEDERPIWVLAWGGGNTLAQSIWRVQQDRTHDELAAFLDRIRLYAITDQDRSYRQGTPFDGSSHQWMRREFEEDLRFLWDESAWKFQNGTGRANWDSYAADIQNHGHLGAIYPIFKYGVEGDTPSFLYVWPNGLNDPENPGGVGWGGYFEWGIGPDSVTRAFVNQDGTSAKEISSRYEKKFYPAIYNSFAARMDWVKNGEGNRNPIVIINEDSSLNFVKLKPEPGTVVTLDASASHDPDGDQLNYSWWVLSEAGSYTSDVAISGQDSDRVTIEVPADSAGTTIHLVCEVTDNGTHELTSYRRIIIEPAGRANDRGE